jgi:hypothetical protein
MWQYCSRCGVRVGWVTVGPIKVAGQPRWWAGDGTVTWWRGSQGGPGSHAVGFCDWRRARRHLGLRHVCRPAEGAGR